METRANQVDDEALDQAWRLAWPALTAAARIRRSAETAGVRPRRGPQRPAAVERARRWGGGAGGRRASLCCLASRAKQLRGRREDSRAPARARRDAGWRTGKRRLSSCCRWDRAGRGLRVVGNGTSKLRPGAHNRTLRVPSRVCASPGEVRSPRGRAVRGCRRRTRRSSGWGRSSTSRGGRHHRVKRGSGVRWKVALTLHGAARGCGPRESARVRRREAPQRWWCRWRRWSFRRPAEIRRAPAVRRGERRIGEREAACEEMAGARSSAGGCGGAALESRASQTLGGWRPGRGSSRARELGRATGGGRRGPSRAMGRCRG
jgi:hypothetical protein